MAERSITVTCCELRDQAADMASDWESLKHHCQQQETELLLLPEMPFYPWLATAREYDPDLWKRSVEQHETWISRLAELQVPIVLGTRPIIESGKNFNEGFVWTESLGYQPVHRKCFLPDEEFFWEAKWYQRGDGQFELFQVDGINIGFLICTEMWFLEHARAYGRNDAHILVCPRATGLASADKWLAGGRAAATCSGAFCLSSNRGGNGPEGFQWGSNAWIIHPEEADVLAVSSGDEPFVSQTVQLADAVQAKSTYPRYVLE